MKELRKNFERFCYNNRDKGIPNLMLYLVIGSGIVYLIGMFGGEGLYQLLCFDKGAILQGQVWRLLTYVFTYAPGSNPVLILVGLYFFYNLGRHVEASMGTFRFNLYYLVGIVLMDVFAMIFCPTQPVTIEGMLYSAESICQAVCANMAYYLHLSIILTFSTCYPSAQFLVLFIIPVKAWFLALIDLLLIAYEIFIYSQLPIFPLNLLPLVGVANYLLFAGKDVVNLFPFLQGIRRKKPQKKTGTIPFTPKQEVRDFTHRCRVCGRTDVTNPELEFRYCSRCNGYHCYCQEHINNHTHVE